MTKQQTTIESLAKEDGASPDMVQENMERLRQIFPEVFVGGKIDFDALKQTLGDYADEREERYSFTWHGKSQARRIAQLPSTGTLRPCPEESVNWDATKNIFIEGDNLEVLKLLQKSYHRKVKMIYIDPPYNTGKEFIYPDKWQDNLDTYLRYTGQVDDKGFKVSANAESSGRYHTNWLNMMYPRLRLARNLLDTDGVIFISIDDHELANLRHVCDEIFGQENRVAIICHKSRASVSNDRLLSTSHNFILLYAKSAAALDARRTEFGLPPNLDGFDQKDERGAFKYVPVDGPGGAAKGNPHYTFLGVTGYFRFSKARMERMHQNGLVEKVGSALQQKYYLEKAKKARRTDTTWWDDKLYTATASRRLKDLMGGAVFDNPKPLELIQRMLTLWAREGEPIVLDFFAGSGTTGHAVYSQNALDEGKRRYVLVQLPEEIPEGKGQESALKFCEELNVQPTIAELSKERLRRAGRLLEADGASEHDLGFKVFKLASSNVRRWDASFDTIEQDLSDAIDNIKPDRAEADVLYELLLKYGLDLATPTESRAIDSRTVTVIGAGALIACLADDISLDVVQGIAALKDELKPDVMHVVFKDSGFKDDVVKTNAAQILRQAGVDDVKTL